MKIFKGILFGLIAVLVFSSGSYALITKSGDFLVDTYTKIEDFIISVSEVSEIQYEEYYVSNPGMDNAYESLSEKQKEIYRKIYGMSQRMPEGYIKLCKKYPTVDRDITIAYNAFLYDKVEIFWMPYFYMVSTYEDDNGVDYTAIAFSVENEKRKIDYNISAEKRDEMVKTLDKKVNSIVKQAEKFKGQYEKEKFFNDYICQNTEYRLEGNLIGSAYGALIQKKAHCEGYSRAFKLLCNKVGIVCDMVCGTSQGEGHMWNLVNLDGIYSYVDVTWNDQMPDNETYMYFNITTKQLSADHELAPAFNGLSDAEIETGSFNFVSQLATYSGNTYYARSGKVLGLEYDKQAAQIVTEANTKGEKSVEMLISSKIAIGELEKNDMDFIKKIQSHLDGIIIHSYAFERDVVILYWN